MEEEYHIKFPKSDALFLNDNLSFSIEHIRSRETSTLYFKIDFFDMHNQLLYTYTAPRWIIDTVYSLRYRNFNIPSDVAENSAYYQITLIACGITSENPLWFNNIMFQEGEYDDYHTVDEQITEYPVELNKSSYVNFYNGNGYYLQIIRPSKKSLHTNRLDACQCTVIAPHLDEESVFDDPISVFLEFINMAEQDIDVLR
ncbi:MAG: hypothetical protein J6Y78_04390 [Paludibacteraceae bacterium]|nr:hypothetical protein [Paludibacteraceae bacterium]